MGISVIHRFTFDEEQMRSLQPAALRDRVMAQLIDGIILGVITGLVLAIASGGKLYSVWISPMLPVYLVQVAPDFVSSAGDWWWGGRFVTISLPLLADFHLTYPAPLLYLIYALYYTLFHSLYGQTPGKMLKGLVVLNARNRFLPLSGAFLRWAGYLISLLPLGLGFWTSAFHSQNRTWHDRMTGSTVWRFLPF